MKKNTGFFKGILALVLVFGLLLTGCPQEASEEKESAPAIPSGIAATAASSSSIIVNWDAVTGATSYKVYRSASENGTYDEKGSLSAPPYRDTGLTAGTTYYYKVSALNAGGESAKSIFVSAKTEEAGTDAPSGVSAAAASSSSITVTWEAVTGAASYKVYRSASENGTYEAKGSPSTPSYTDTGLTAETTYYYKVSALNAAGKEGAQSGPVSAKTEEAGTDAPSGVSAEAASSSSITVTWEAVTGAASYKVYRSASEDGTYEAKGSPSTPSYTDTGLTAETTYYYKVSALNAAGKEGAQSGPVSAKTAVSNGEDLGISWDSETDGTLTTLNNASKDMVIFHGQTPSASNMIGGVRARLCQKP